MTDEFDPTTRARESWGDRSSTADDAGPGGSDAEPGRTLNVTPEELSTPHDQPVEGGVEEAEDGGAAGTPDIARGDTSPR